MAKSKVARPYKGETLAIGWCDNGMVDGKFAEGIVYTMLNSPAPVTQAVRISGNQIARQRQSLIDAWYDEMDTDWLLWVDSDVVLTTEILTTLWTHKHKNDRPMITGVYMVTKSPENSLMVPMPDLFYNTDKTDVLEFVHPMPFNELIKVDSAGFGLLLMHRSVVKRLRDAGHDIMFYEEMKNKRDAFLGEDIYFFRKCASIGIPLYAHTGAIGKHMKRFAFDQAYYGAYWKLQELYSRVQSEESNPQGV